MRVYHDADCDIGLVRHRRIAIVGYGNQGHAHALNLRDSGVAEIKIALRDGSASAGRARDAGFETVSNAEAARWADIVMLLAPDENQATIYADDLAPNMRAGAALGFAHGLNVHFGLLLPRADLDVFMVAPKGPGMALRSEYERGGGLISLFAVAQDASGSAETLALSYAAALGSGRLGMLRTSFAEECEADLFNEQAVVWGAIPELIRTGFEILVDAGFSPEVAYLECVGELKLIGDLIDARGIAGMREAISTTAEYGGYLGGPRIVTDQTRAEMQNVLDDIRHGGFTKRFIADNQAGNPELGAARRRDAAHPIEATAARLRAIKTSRERKE